MRKILQLSAAALVLFAFALPSVAQDGKDPVKPQVFKKPFKERVEDAVDRGCDWLKTQQGVEPGEDPAVFGRLKEQPLYSPGTPHNYRIGRTAFPIQALCKSGVFADDKHIVKAMNYLRKNYTDQGAIQMMKGFVGSVSYEDATVLNAVEAYYISQWEAKARGLANKKSRFKRVEVDGKKRRVAIKRWGTEEKGAKKKKKKRVFKLSKKDRKVCEIAIKALESKFRRAYGGGGWRYARKGVGQTKPMIDCSATQYAMLGFKCATRLGMGYDKSMIMESVHYYLRQQDKDGPEVSRRKREDDSEEAKKKKKKDPEKSTSSRRYRPAKKDRARGWGYNRQDKHQDGDERTYGSMTAAGICGLILMLSDLENDPRMQKRWSKMKDKVQQAIYDGLAWLVVNWTMTENPQRGKHRYYYYLYTIERLGMLGEIDYIGSHDWYYEGAEVLLNDQHTEEGKDHGMWDIGNEITPSDVYNTCYALLFLKKATAGIDRPVPVITGRDGED